MAKIKCSCSLCFMIYDVKENGEISQLAGAEFTDAEEKHLDTHVYSLGAPDLHP